MRKDWFERAMSKSTVDPSTGCWLFNGSRTPKGYGHLSDNRTYNMIRVHRLSYRELKGEIPNGMLVCHKCDVRNCWNPDHLFLGTHQDNMDDMIRKGRANFGTPPGNSIRGEDSPNAKLTEEKVIEIRRRFFAGGITKLDLSKEYGVCDKTIGVMIKGRTWKHVPLARSKAALEVQNPPQGGQRPSQSNPNSHHLARSRTNQD